ncbi:MAG TPA: CHASE4 domain-containing protein [Methanoregulaceae archaeon]|nr:CHASE4 domain-containing protein [Methanoregulaceae archaeon]HRY74773.1 CHASE4 domain-containing protein [Methanoregulaceae archaeon]
MNLREKTLVIVGITFIIAFVLILAISFTFYTSTVLDLEEQQAEKDALRVVYSFDNELAGMEGTVGDWAWWDDTYVFAQDFNDEFLQSNLGAGTFETLNLDYWVIISPDGNVLFAKAYDTRTGQEVPVPEDFLGVLPPTTPPYDFPKNNGIVSGVLNTPSGPVLVVSAPILTSDQTGPSPGYLVMARKVDEAEREKVARLSGESVFFPAQSPLPDGSPGIFAPRPLNPASIVLNRTDPESLTAVSTLDDPAGDPVFSLGIRQSRDTYRNALTLIRSYFITITIMMALFAGLVILIIDKLVLARLSVLISRVPDRSRLSEGELLPPMPGNDEFNRLDTVIAESQQQIYEAEAKFRRIVETAQEGICVVDADFRLTYANERLAKMYGSSVQDLIGRPMTTLVSVEEIADQQERNRNRREGISETYERTFIRKDGSVFNGVVSATPVFTDSVFSGSFVMITDITDRKRAESALQLATRKLNVLSRSARTDLTNQLFTLQGYIELSLHLAEGKLKDYIKKQQDAAGRIQNQLAYINHFQDLGIQPPKWQNVNNVFLYAISHLDMSNVTRTIALGSLEVFADPLLEKVLSTLSENSLVHGKTVTEIRCSCRQEGPDLIILYEDNGIGIPDDEKEKIFGHHYTDKGLPLSLAREILSITGMTIRETGSYGKGARFEIQVRRGYYRFGGP